MLVRIVKRVAQRGGTCTWTYRIDTKSTPTRSSERVGWVVFFACATLFWTSPSP